MALLNRIEVSNFIRQRDYDQWTPMILRLVFNFRGHNSLVHMTNGLGKTSIIDAVMALLGRDHELFSITKRDKMAPLSTNRFSHIRVESLRRTGPVAQEDMIGKLGVDVPGEKHVFGLFGNSDANAAHGFYCYRGTLEDCPVSYTDDKNTYLVDNKTFREQLKKMKDVKTSGASLTKDDWRDEIGKHFELPDIDKMTAYQKTGAGDSIQSFYNVKPMRGESYGSAFFFSHLAPELLTDIMGEDGEPDEKYLENTIFNSTIIVRKAQRKCEQEQNILEDIEKKMQAVEPILDKCRAMDHAKAERDKALVDFELGARIIEETTINNQVLGIPSTALPADHKAAAIAASMVLQEGLWYVMDRMLADICNEEVREINYRASRKQTASIDADRMQLIENPCDTAPQRRDVGGIPNKLYTLNNGVQLISLAPNLKQGWTKETAIAALEQAFKWAETADTNVFRHEMRNTQAAISIATDRIEELGRTIDACNKILKDLAEKESKLTDDRLAYRKMEESGRFSTQELNDPEETGKSVTAALKEAQNKLQDHTRKVGEFGTPYEIWKRLEAVHGKGFEPALILDELELTISTAQNAWDSNRTALEALRKEKDNEQKKQNEPTNRLMQIERKLSAFTDLTHQIDKYSEQFGSENPSGLKERLTKNSKSLTDEINKLTKQIAVWRNDLDSLKNFRVAHGNADPSEWIDVQLGKLYSAREDRKNTEDRKRDLVRRRAELDKAQVASGELYGKALSAAGSNAVPLYKVVEEMELPQALRASVLTLFSNFLFAPTFDTAQAAETCARLFVEDRIEAPVFIRSELEHYFRRCEIREIPQAAYTYFLGIRTRPVDCLLNPAFIEEEKKALDKAIAETLNEITLAEEIIANLDPESSEMQTARKAVNAVKDRLEVKFRLADKEVARKQADLETVQIKLQNSHLIDAVLKFNSLGGHKEHERLATENASIKNNLKNIETAVRQLEDRIPELEVAEKEARNSYLSATGQRDAIGELRTVQAFLDHGGPAFMETAEAVAVELTRTLNSAEERNRFDFASAQRFIDSGGPRAFDEIGIEIETNTKKKDDADRDLTQLVVDRRQMEEALAELKINTIRLDDLARSFIKKYRNIARIKASLGDKRSVDLPEDENLKRIRKEIKIIKENKSKAVLIEQMGKLSAEVEQINIEVLKSSMDQASQRLESETSSFHSEIDRVCKGVDNSLTETDRAWLKESKEKPEKILEMHDIWKTDLNSRTEAHQISLNAVEQSRSELTQRLVSLLSRLTYFFGILRDTVRWKERSDGSVEPGYQIDSRIIGQEELPALIDRIVTVVETDEKRREEDREAGRMESIEDADIRNKIKEMFYREVFKNPEIHIYNQELGKRTLPFSDTFSTGQRMALTLLWMLKIADFAVERNIRRETATSGQRKRLRSQQERMFIIDGIFSNISNKDLIKETLSAIGRLKTKFQLIGFYHNPVFVYDEDIFPVYIFGNQMRSPESPSGFVYVRDGKMVSPEEMGAATGQIATIETHFDKIDDHRKKMQ